MRNREILFIVRMRNETRKALGGLRGDLSRTAKKARAASASVSKLDATAKRAGAGMKAAGVGATAMGAGMGRASVAARGLLTTIAPLLGALTFVAAIKTIGDFEKQMQAVRAITGATNKEFVALEREARRLGATTVFSATEAAGGLEFLARAGFTANEAIKAVGATLNLAVVGNLGLAESADIVSNVMQAFGIEVTKTAEATDVLSFVAASSNTNVQQLGSAMKFAAPIANALGVSLNDTAAAIGVLGNAGVQASLAGTGMRQSLLRLIDTTPKATRALRSLGLEFSDVDPRTRSLAEIFKTLQDAGLDASRAIQLFGIRTSGTALILTAGADKLKELAEEAKNVSGFAEEAARIMQDNLTDAFKQLVSSIQEAIIAFGKGGFGAALRDTIDTITGAVRVLSGFEGAAENATTASRILAVAIKALGATFAVFLGLKVVSGVVAMGASILRMTGIIKLARKAQLAFNVAMLLNPVVLVAAAAVALGVGIGLLLKNTKELTKEQRELIRIGNDLRILEESAGRDSQVSIKKQIEALTAMRAIRVQLLVDARNRAVVLKKIAGETKLKVDVTAAAVAARVVRTLESAVNATKIRILLLNSALKDGSTDLSRTAKKASALTEALKKVGLVGANVQTTLDGLLDANVKGRAATEKNASALIFLNKQLKLSEKFLKAQGTSLDEVRQAIAKLTREEELNISVVEATINSLKEEAFLAGKSIEQKKVEIEVIKARTAALKLGEAFGPEQERRVRRQAEITAAAVKASKDKLKADRESIAVEGRATRRKESFEAQLRKTIASIDLETANIGRSTEATRRARVVQEQRNKARKAGILDAVKLAQVEDEVTAALDRQRAAELKARGDAIAGAKKGLKSFIDEAQDLNKQFEGFTTSTLNNLTDAITEFAETGKVSFKSLADAAIADLQRIVSKGLVADLAGVFGLTGTGGQKGGGGGDLLSGLGSLVANLFQSNDGGDSVAHGGGGGGGGGLLADLGSTIAGFFQSSGGVVGRDGRPGVFSAAAFAHAQRFQLGGRVQPRGTDSVPILATPGEVVLTEEQAGSLRRVLETRNVGGLAPSPTVRQPFGGAIDARGVSNEVTVVMNINTPDVSGFRRSQGQIGAEAAASINRALRRNG